MVNKGKVYWSAAHKVRRPWSFFCSKPCKEALCPADGNCPWRRKYIFKFCTIALDAPLNEGLPKGVWQEGYLIFIKIFNVYDNKRQRLRVLQNPA